MILNWFLLLLTAFIAYVGGSVSTRRVASRYVFKRDLTKLGRGNTWLSNFEQFKIASCIYNLIVKRIVFIAHNFVQQIQFSVAVKHILSPY